MTDKVAEIPFQVGGRIILRFRKGEQENRILSQVVGFKRGQFLIIDQPESGDSLSVISDNAFICCYTHEGDLYFFAGKVKKILDEELTLIEYPFQFQKKAVRRHQRVPVKVETGVYLVDEDRKLVKSVDDYKNRMLKATMVDISEGGCRLLVRSFETMVQNISCRIECTLPDGQRIEGLKSLVTSVRQIDEFTSEVGLRFLGPMDQIGKIFFFCQLALSIKNPG